LKIDFLSVFTGVKNEMEFRPDFPAVKERWRRYHKGESKRPMVLTVVPKAGMAPVPAPGCFRCAFGDIDKIAEDVLRAAASREFLGDAIPSYQINFTAGHLAPLLGAGLKYNPASPDTTWIVPRQASLSDVEIRFDPENEWWERTVDCIRRLRRHFDGKLILYGPRLVGGLDCLAAMRGTQELLMDLMDNPDDVHRALAQVDRALDEIRPRLAQELDVKRFGSMTRFGIYHEGMMDAPQCDFSAMIGPEMFREFELPSLRKQIAGLDDATYHLDGQDAIKHLEAVCEIEKITALQWVPGAQLAPVDDDWRSLHRRIDALGKGQVYDAVPVTTDKIVDLWGSLSSRRQVFRLKVKTKDEFLRFMDKLETV
jgi:5-methyltetrahydrofolate--homocysteine methyltransferase